MRIELTQQSGLEVNHLSAADMTPAMAAQYLNGAIHIRGFWEMLRRFHSGGDLRDLVIQAVSQPGDDPKSVTRRVRNWEQGKNTPASREDLFRISFALGLNEEQASTLLGMCTDYSIHYRNGRELTYAYCLRRGLTYAQASALYTSLPDPNRGQAGDCSAARFQDTRQIVSVFADVSDDTEFARLYAAYLDSFGTMHRVRNGIPLKKRPRLISRSTCRLEAGVTTTRWFSGCSSRGGPTRPN